jgi:hypothetical protein
VVETRVSWWFGGYWSTIKLHHLHSVGIDARGIVNGEVYKRIAAFDSRLAMKYLSEVLSLVSEELEYFSASS